MNNAVIPTKVSMKKILAILLAVAISTIALIAIPACNSDANSNAVNIKLKVPRTSHNVVFDDEIKQVHQVIEIMAADFEENYDKPVNIDVEVFEQNQYDSAVTESLDTDKAPDILYGDYFNISSYIHTGHVVTLDGVLPQEIQDDLVPYLVRRSTMHDRQYIMPYLARQNVLGYNKQLFEQAGLSDYIDDSQIQSWTLDEWTYILDTLAKNLPENTYPMMMYANSSQGDTHTMTLLRAAGSEFFDDEGHFNISTPEGIAALRWIQSGVDRGWFPPHAENLEVEDCSSLFKSGQLAIYMINNASIGRYGDTIGLVNFPGPDENGCATAFASGFEIFDNGDAEKVEIAKDFLRYVYSNDELMSYAAGAMPASRNVFNEYGDQIIAFDLFLQNMDNVVDFIGDNPDTLATRDVFHKCLYALLAGDATPEETAARIDQECNKIIDDAKLAAEHHD